MPRTPNRRPTRLLVVTNIYPTPDRPNMSPFVARRVAALRERGVEVVVAGPASYRSNSLFRHLGILRRALTARGPFDGVESHPVYFAGVIGLVAARLRRIPMVAYAPAATSPTTPFATGSTARSPDGWSAGPVPSWPTRETPPASSSGSARRPESSRRAWT